MSHNRNKILFIPYFDENPYQELLARAIEEKGAEVIRSPFKWNLLNTYIKHHFSAIHIHWTHPWILKGNRFTFFVKLFFWITQLLFFRAIGVKLIWTVHNLKDHEKRNPVRDKIFNRVNARLASQLLVHSRQAQHKVSRHFGINQEKIQICNHGNYLTWYSHDTDRKKARRKLNIAPDTFVYLAFGAIRPYKNTLLLIEQFNKLKQPNALLLIAGQCRENSLREKIVHHQKNSSNRIRLDLKHISDDEVKFYMKSADVAVHPYESILTSGAVILSMGYALPCILPDLDSFHEIPGDAGAIFYKQEEEDGLLIGLQKASSRAADLNAMGTANLTRVKEHDWESIGQATIDAYQG